MRSTVMRRALTPIISVVVIAGLWFVRQGGAETGSPVRERPQITVAPTISPATPQPAARAGPTPDSLNPVITHYPNYLPPDQGLLDEVAAAASVRACPDGWRTFRSDHHGIGLCHPSNWTVRSHEPPLPTVPRGSDRVLLQVDKNVPFPGPHIVVSTGSGYTTLGCPHAGSLLVDGITGRVCFLGEQFTAISWLIGIRLPVGKDGLPFVSIVLELPFQPTPDGRNPVPLQDRRDGLEIIASLRFDR